MTFDAERYVIDMNRGRGEPRPYLPVAARIMWFRDEHPGGSITTEVIDVPRMLVRATVTDEAGHVMATGLGSVPPNSERAVWNGREFEKAETAAIGRALAHAGYGTQFLDEDGDFLADSPAQRPATPPRPAPRVEPPAKPKNGGDRPYRPAKLYERLREIAAAESAPNSVISNGQAETLRTRTSEHMEQPIEAYLMSVTFGVGGEDYLKKLTSKQMKAILKWLDSDPAILSAEIGAVMDEAKASEEFNALGE